MLLVNRKCKINVKIAISRSHPCILNHLCAFLNDKKMGVPKEDKLLCGPFNNCRFNLFEKELIFGGPHISKSSSSFEFIEVVTRRATGQWRLLYRNNNRTRGQWIAIRTGDRIGHLFRDLSLGSKRLCYTAFMATLCCHAVRLEAVAQWGNCKELLNERKQRHRLNYSFATRTIIIIFFGRIGKIPQFLVKIHASYKNPFFPKKTGLFLLKMLK